MPTIKKIRKYFFIKKKFASNENESSNCCAQSAHGQTSSPQNAIPTCLSVPPHHFLTVSSQLQRISSVTVDFRAFVSETTFIRKYQFHVHVALFFHFFFCNPPIFPKNTKILLFQRFEPIATHLLRNRWVQGFSPETTFIRKYPLYVHFAFFCKISSLFYQHFSRKH